uniref:Uncharacterized protein n=1 Tax=Arundo donax TaxID=35708 RepID=A0A0A9FD57_ARUDO
MHVYIASILFSDDNEETEYCMSILQFWSAYACLFCLVGQVGQ